MQVGGGGEGDGEAGGEAGGQGDGEVSGMGMRMEGGEYGIAVVRNKVKYQKKKVTSDTRCYATLFGPKPKVRIGGKRRDMTRNGEMRRYLTR